MIAVLDGLDVEPLLLGAGVTRSQLAAVRARLLNERSPNPIVSRDGPGDSQRRPSADRNSAAGGSLIRTDGLEGAVLRGCVTHVVHPCGSSNSGRCLRRRLTLGSGLAALLPGGDAVSVLAHLGGDGRPECLG